MIRSVTIIGMGALGILYGDAFSKALGPDKVRFLASGDRLARCRQADVTYNGEPCHFHISDGSDGPAELLLFAVKAPDLEEAIALAQPVVDEDTIILSLLNGVTSEETLSAAFGPAKVLYTVVQGMDAVRTGTALTCHSQGSAYIGRPQEDYFDREEKVQQAVDLFRRAGLTVYQEEDVEHRMWCKFMLNVGINQVCMAYQCSYGPAQVPGEIRDTMIAAMQEARKVGACQGILVTQRDLEEYLAVLDALDPEGMPSMRQDALAGRPSEVESFAGTVLALARRFGMRAPVNQKLYDIIKEMETKC